MKPIDPTRELLLSRTYRAPKSLVLKMWSDPALLAGWWGPYGFTTTAHQMDFRSGGSWKFTMHGPDGTDYPNHIRYGQIDEGQIAYDHIGEDGEIRFQVLVTFTEPAEGQTQMDFRMTFPTPEDYRRIVETYGADKGLAQTTARLDTILADEQAEREPFKMWLSTPSDTEMRMVRHFRAPRELVYDAFTQAELVSQWQSPYKYTFTDCAFDARPGGKWRMAHTDAEGNTYRFFGDVLEALRPERLVATFEFDGFPGHYQKNTTTFDTINDLTRVTVLSECGTKEQRDAMLDSGMEWGMGQSYERLEALLAGPKGN